MQLFERIERLPVPVLPTMVGALTLSNVYNGLGFAWIRHIMMVIASVVWCIYLIKIIKYPKICYGEYCQTVPASLYAGFTMIMMLVASYLFTYNATIGSVLMYVAIALHALHIVVFTFRNIIKNRNWATTVPSWYVTYNGILVSCVVGVGIVDQNILQIITIYGIVAYLVLLPFMIYRLLTKPIADPVYLTQAILLAPASLCAVAYLNTFAHPSMMWEVVFYALVLASLLFVIIKLPKFVNRPFHPGFAALTFPMAIGIVATQKMAAYVSLHHAEAIGGYLTQLAGIQIYITTAIIGFVLMNFYLMLTKKKAK